jgi:hypothetical protein
MCKSCEVLVINGILCHETGCPDSWKDKKHFCKECGEEFEPESKFQDCCSSHCYCMYNGLVCECDDCQEVCLDSEKDY